MCVDHLSNVYPPLTHAGLLLAVLLSEPQVPGPGEELSEVSGVVRGGTQQTKEPPIPAGRYYTYIHTYITYNYYTYMYIQGYPKVKTRLLVTSLLRVLPPELQVALLIQKRDTNYSSSNTHLEFSSERAGVTSFPPIDD